jgi:ferredoxin-NADP reductase
MSEEPIGRHLAEALPPWNPETEPLVCRQVRAETHDVKTFTFGTAEPRLFQFLPGQFLTFDWPVGGSIINRCYTIASPPTRPHRLSITVKRHPDGPVSNWLHDHLRPGMEVSAIGPMGVFSTVHHPAEKQLFLSGGSGITPLMSMARSYADLALPCDIVFVHNARSPADIIFRAELELMTRTLPGFRVVTVCETDAPGEVWGGHRGRLTLPMLRLIAPDLIEREIFTCGPPPYMAAVRAMLGETGFDIAHYHQESFDFAEMAAEQPALNAAVIAAESAIPRYRIEFTKSGRSIECDANTHILQAAFAAGMRLPSSCTVGLCGTCKSRLVAGEVEMKHQGGIRQREIDNGQVLICCSKPRSDLVIER